ncbi:MAG TPA: fluoride efflux transporter CrcB [Gammaproteobacteria bacterium]|nr:fluoride efflux transporter CrcB [Gammaproteobacteria bacterium]
MYSRDQFLFRVIAIALGGSIGAVLRYAIANGIHMFLGRGFPYGTLIVNVVGSLGMGVLYVLLLERLSLGPEWRAALQIGLLGALTTFSTFSMETLLLFENGEAQKAILNITLNVVLCLGATWLGMVLGRQI